MERRATEAFHVAKFGAGAYFISGNLTLADHAVAAVHEDLHGILRRSTPFGAILRVLEGMLSSSSAERDLAFLHVLASRGRTSEEVMATYGALLSARATGPDKPVALAAQKALVTHLGYKVYAKIGEELVGTEPPAVAGMALDALIRFCWSARALPPIEEVAADLSILRTMNSEAFPDRRLALLRKSWSVAKLRECLSVLSDQTRALLEAQPPTARDLFQISDDVELLLPPDAAAEVDQLVLQFATAQAMVAERSVAIIFAKLCEMYPEDPLAAKANEEVQSYVETSRRLPVGKARTGYEFPEIVHLRAERRKVWSVGVEKVPPGAAVFVRSRDTFERQLQLIGGTGPRGPITAYRAWGGALQATAPGEALPIHLLETEVDDPKLLAQSILNGNHLIAIWASAYLTSPQTFAHLFHRGAGVWLICDVQPSQLLKSVHPLIPELRAEWLAPARDQQGVGVMIAPQVGTAGPLDGIAFPGSAVVCNGQLLIMMRTMLGDSLRGVGRGPLFYEEAYRRQAEATFLADWLIQTEQSFSFLEVPR